MMAKNNNAFLISLTESWLSEGVMDAEIYLNGFSAIRSDRCDREGGGVITYIKDNFTASHELTMSDSISELLCVFIQELKLAVITVYRPPGTNNESFNLVLNKMDEWLNNLHGELKDVDVLITGDFNLGNLHEWDDAFISEYVKKVKDRRENDEFIGSDTNQAANLIDFSKKWNLTQMVKNNTRDGNILDLIFTNNSDMICEISHDKHSKMSDHDTLIVNTNYDYDNKEEEHKKNFCSTEIPLYNTEDMDNDQINKAKEFLEAQDWDNVTPESLTKTIEEMVKDFCKLRNPIKNKGTDFKSRNRIPRIVQKWLRKKNLL